MANKTRHFRTKISMVSFPGCNIFKLPVINGESKKSCEICPAFLSGTDKHIFGLINIYNKSIIINLGTTFIYYTNQSGYVPEYIF